jgi:ABC-type antimicrobial peptide transport system, permease component
MKLGLFFRLACSNIKKNHQLYVPHILAGTGLVGVFYVMLTLANDERIENIKGGYAIPAIMGIGCAVVAILSVILVFFTNSFLMKQRTREYGMYNVLGMEKRHVGRIMFFENLISTAISLVSGVLFGILVYKLCCLFICKMLHVETILGFYVDPMCILKTVGGFIAMYFAAFLWNRFRLARLRPVELLASAGAGEKEPKVKWILLVIGLATLGAGYYIALTTESPLKAIPDFFKAVVLVIIGTYALFLAGSIAFLKLLRKNKGFYYRRKNMIAVSDLLYRMKQNAVGLASIAILATGVIVMMSTTVCLYTGTEETIKTYFLDGDADIFVRTVCRYSEEKDGKWESHHFQLSEEEVRKLTEKTVEKFGSKVVSFKPMRNFSDVFHFENGKGSIYEMHSSFVTIPAGTVQLIILPMEDYNGLSKQPVTLADGEVGWFALSGNSPAITKTVPEQFTIGGQSFRIAKEVKKLSLTPSEAYTTDTYGLVVPSIESLEAIIDGLDRELQEKYNGDSRYYLYGSAHYTYSVQVADAKKLAEVDTEMEMESTFGMYLRDRMDELGYNEDHTDGYAFWDSTWRMRNELFAIYGSLFFLGILLSMVFLFATALIIYYKQISEGYDDRGRFQILQKVGMTQSETKGTIRRQILIVFFLPLLTAVVHMLVAYPVIRKLLQLLMMPNDKLFLTCTGLTIVAFALIYMVIYRLTARTYYRIVR